VLLRLVAAATMGALLGSHAAGRIADMPAAEDARTGAAELPVGIAVRNTDFGLVFADDAGMTLYLRQGNVSCAVTLDPPDANLPPILQDYAAYPAPPCGRQWPAALVPADAQPKGDWSIVTSAEGQKQWAYKGAPVHRSYKDLLPGDVNGIATRYLGIRDREEWSVAVPDQAKLPPGITAWTRTGVGLIAARAEGALYVFDGPSKPRPAQKRARLGQAAVECAKDCTERWQPLPVSESSHGMGEWLVMRLSDDGRAVWGYRNRVLYTFVGDHEHSDTNGAGVDQAKLVVLRPAPPVPRGIFTSVTPIGIVYADPKGMTLYEFTCDLRHANGAVLDSSRRYTCDGWNDDVGQREQFCPGPDRCAEMWRPLQVARGTVPRGGLWSVVVIPDPKRYPLRWVPTTDEAAQRPGAIKVATYMGRPLYTFTRDREQGDYFGSYVHQNTGQRWGVVRAAEGLEAEGLPYRTE
jgi:predicted lipoprotein with Yx(FWY)xxD motif